MTRELNALRGKEGNVSAELEKYKLETQNVKTKLDQVLVDNERISGLLQEAK
jgi:hypothetical protein